LHFRVPYSDLPKMYLHPLAALLVLVQSFLWGATRTHQVLVQCSQYISVKFQVHPDSAKGLMPFLARRITKYLRTDPSPNRQEEPISSCFSGKILPALPRLHMEAERC